MPSVIIGKKTITYKGKKDAIVKNILKYIKKGGKLKRNDQTLLDDPETRRAMIRQLMIARFTKRGEGWKTK